MTTDTLELPPIDADMIDKPPVTTAVATAAAQAEDRPTLKQTALASFEPIEAHMRTLAARYKDVAYDVTTTKGMADAKAARLVLREEGRYAVQRLQDRLKKEANDLKRTLDAKGDELIALVKPAEDAIHAQIEAEEKRKEAEREAKAAKERERIAGLDARLAALSAWVDRCKEPGMTAERIEKGIALLEDALIDPAEWQEYAARAEARKAEVLGVMNDLYGQAVAREAEAARLESQRLENERIAAEQAERQAALAAQERQSRAVTRFGTSLAAAIARVGIGRVTEVLPEQGTRADLLTADEMNAYADALDALQPHPITPDAQESGSNPADEPAPVDAPGMCASSTVESAEAVPSGEEGEGAHADESAPTPDYGALEAELVDGPASLETSEAEAVHIKTEDLPALPPPAPATQSAIHLCWDLLQVLKTPYAGRFPSHPKPGPEWWADVRSRIEALEPRLSKMVGAQ